MAKDSAPAEWSEWSEWLSSGLDGRHRWRLAPLLAGLLFGRGRRTVTSWLRAAALSHDFAAFFYFIACVGRKSESIATQLLTLALRHVPLPERVLAVIDDSPTKRYGPKVEGADIHHNPTPGPADQAYLYGHVWVTISLAIRHPSWGTIALPLRALLYVRQQTMERIPKRRGWTFRTKLELALTLVLWLAPLLKKAGKTAWIVADGFYAKRPVLEGARAAGVVVVSRLRKDAALRDLPAKTKTKGRGRPRLYGPNKISLAKRGAQKKGWSRVGCVVYGKTVTKTYKTFLATYRPARGVIRVVIVKEDHGCQHFFSTDPEATPQAIIEAFADRAAIEQDFHDVKEVWGASQQQVRNIWTNVGCFNLNLWVCTLVELWAWRKPKSLLCDRRDSPWDDPDRRPSHADRRNALRRLILQTEFKSLAASGPIPRKILDFANRLIKTAA